MRCLITLCLLILACGEDPARTIGPGGGMVQGEGVTVVVPPGALTSDVQILIERTDVPEGFAAVGGRAFRFTPAGLTFEVPLTV